MSTVDLKNESEAKKSAVRDFDILDTPSEQVFDDLVKIAAVSLNVPVAVISFRDGDRLWFKARYGINLKEIPCEQSFCQEAMKNAHSVLVVEDARSDDKFKDSPLVEGEPYINFYAGAPLTTKNHEVLGTLFIVDHEPRKLTGDQKNTLVALSRQIMSVLELRKSNRELSNDQQHIQSRDSRYQHLIESVDDMIFELDERGNFVYANPAMLSVTGYEQAELLSMNYQDILSEEGMAQAFDTFKGQIRLKEQKNYIELKIQPKGESEQIDVGLKIEVVQKGDVVEHIYAIARDITELIKARLQLADREEKYRILSENSRDLIALLEPDGTYRYLSASCKELLGYEPEELIGVNSYTLFYPDDLDKVKSHAYNEFFNGQKPSSIEFRIKKKDGTYTWFESYNKPIYDDQHRLVAIQNSSRDITTRKEHEFKLESADLSLNQYKEGLELLNQISANSDLTAEQQIYEALWVSTEFLELETGVLSKVDGEEYTIENVYGSMNKWQKGQTVNLSDVFCEVSYKKEDIFSIDHVSKTTLKVHKCFVQYQVEAYISIPYYVSGEKRGTISFSSSNPHDGPFDQNAFEFIKLLARWIGFLIQQQEYEKNLMADKMILQAFVSSAPAAIAMFDAEVQYIAASDKWYDDYDLQDEYIIGRSYFDVFPDVGPEWEKVFENALAGNIEYNEQDLIEQANGEIKWIKWEVRPWFKKLEVVGGLIMYTEDISYQKEQQLQLKIAKRKAEQASKAKEQFLSTMSHEIRTPLNAIIGMTDLMLMEDQDDEQLKRLKLLKFSGNNLLVLINDILDFNKIEAGKLEFEIADFSLKGLLDKTRASLMNLAEKKGLELNLSYDPELPEFFKGDVVRIGQVVTNLVNNAIKFTESGYVSIKARKAHQEEDNYTIKFEIKDTGIGIAKDKVDTIFQSFEQAGSDITRRYGGTGLGLAITKRILELMSSQIQVHSAEGLGSVFYFDITLPLGESTATDKVQLEGKAELRDDLRILVAEDNPGNRTLIHSLFRRWKINLEFAEDGQQAIDKIQAKDFDMIFMDLQMPEVDGYEATEAIRAMDDEYFKKIPIVALTASVMSNVLEKTRQVGMNAYVPKPFNPNELKQTIAKYTSGKEIDLRHDEISVEESFPYLRQLVGDDENALTEIVNTSIKSVMDAAEGIDVGIEEMSIDRVRKEMHVMRPNLHNLELGKLAANLEVVRELDDDVLDELKKLLKNINNELSSGRFVNFKP
ncbi:MAG: PAS domain S-box protein [Cyclobacteriaceae bacterium]